MRCPDALEVELCMMMTFCFQNCKGQRMSLLYVYIYAWKKEGVYEVLMQNILFPEFQGTKDIITIYICTEKRTSV